MIDGLYNWTIPGLDSLRKICRWVQPPHHRISEEMACIFSGSSFLSEKEKAGWTNMVKSPMLITTYNGYTIHVHCIYFYIK